MRRTTRRAGSAGQAGTRPSRGVDHRTSVMTRDEWVTAFAAAAGAPAPTPDDIDALLELAGRRTRFRAHRRANHPLGRGSPGPAPVRGARPRRITRTPSACVPLTPARGRWARLAVMAFRPRSSSGRGLTSRCTAAGSSGLFPPTSEPWSILNRSEDAYSQHTRDDVRRPPRLSVSCGVWDATRASSRRGRSAIAP